MFEYAYNRIFSSERHSRANYSRVLRNALPYRMDRFYLIGCGRAAWKSFRNVPPLREGFYIEIGPRNTIKSFTHVGKQAHCRRGEKIVNSSRGEDLHSSHVNAGKSFCTIIPYACWTRGQRVPWARTSRINERANRFVPIDNFRFVETSRFSRSNLRSCGRAGIVIVTPLLKSLVITDAAFRRVFAGINRVIHRLPYFIQCAFSLSRHKVNPTILFVLPCMFILTRFKMSKVCLHNVQVLNF